MSDDSADGRALGRRHLLAGVVGGGFVGAGVVGSGVVDVGSVIGSGSGGDPRLPVEVTTVEAPGSTAGSQQVPAAGTPTVIDCFATWCGPCVEQMASLRAAHERYGDDVTFVSVTNERFGGGFDREDLRAWWRDNDGHWTLGHDPEGGLLAALGASGLPYLAVADAAGSVVWTHGGVASAETLGREISSVL